MYGGLDKIVKIEGGVALYSPGAQGVPVCKICPLILTLDPYWGPRGGLK